MNKPVCCFLLAALAAAPAAAQEAGAGFDLLANVTGQAASSSELTGGFRTMLYPTWKLSSHWVFSGVVEAWSTPYFPEEFEAGKFGVRVRVLQANIGYSHAWKRSSLLVRAGQMPSAFGSFLLRYDDTDNPLTAPPLEYGYYLKGVTTLGLTGAQADLTTGRWDARAQFVNSSSASARGPFGKGQYGGWTAGAGYTIRQGLRVGVSAYGSANANGGQPLFYDSRPIRILPARAIGADVAWTRGHWNLQGEWQRFSALGGSAAYAEVRRVLHPRWYIAGRTGYFHTNLGIGGELYEAAVGFRPNTHQLLKLGYETRRESDSGVVNRTIMLQLVTTLHPLSLARR